MITGFDDKGRSNSTKYKWFLRLLCLTLIVFAVRLWDLQIMKGEEFKQLSEQNRIRIKKIVAPRGIIYDRHGKILADTRPSFNLYIIPEDIKDFNQTIDGLAGLLTIDRDAIIERLSMAKDYPPSFPVKIKEDITMDEVAKLEAHRIYLPGVTIQIEPKRNYPHGMMMAHLLGYVSEISKDELKRKEFKDYSPGDTIGRYGLERTYEGYLKGKDGARRVEVDALGREVRTLDVIEPIAGNALYLNIDLDLQIAIENAFENKKGGCIVLDPKTGYVLGLISRPAFDPNILTSGISKKEWQQLSSDTTYPLQNRAIQGRYPPGSTFKIVLALKALEAGVVNENTAFLCRGSFFFGNRAFKCWKKGGHGMVSLKRAIKESCDVYFYNVGLRLGVDRIHDMAETIGITAITGIDLPNEKAGLVPSTEWKKRRYGQPWYEGETVSVSIGQGAVWLTPIELAQLSSFVANEGVTFKPQIVQKVVSPDGRTLKTFGPVMQTNARLKKGVFTAVKEGMREVVNEPGGTAYVSRVEGINISGKTGTAQAASLDAGRHLNDHAWFIAYAPSEDPTLAISLIVEHGGHGATAAAPIAKAIVEQVYKIDGEQKGLRKEARLNAYR